MVNQERLLGTFLALVRIDSPSLEEEAIAHDLVGRLTSLGLTAELDAMNNVIARLAGNGEPILLAAHMDTVMPGHGVNPQVRDGVVYSDGTTILGADDKSGLAIVLEVLETLRERSAPHPDLEVVITVQEEVGLLGAKGLDRSRLRSRLGISFDTASAPGTIAVSAPSHSHLMAIIHGKAAHAGVSPEEGVNAIAAAARAIDRMPLGRIDAETTANVGIVRGGVARNIVPDRVELLGEARSRDVYKLEAQTQAMISALETAAAEFGATVEAVCTRSYEGYTFDQDTPVVRRLMAACRAAGVEPVLVPTGGGSDANIFNHAGMQVVNLSTGMKMVHTLDEHVAIKDMVTCAEIVLNFLSTAVGRLTQD